MTYLRTMLIAVAALSLGALLVGVDSANAQLGTASAALGSGGEGIGRGAPDEEASEGPRSAAPRAAGTCVTNRTAFRTQTDVAQTTSTNYVLMANTHVAVTHTAGCLIVDFAGEVYANNTGTTVIIRARIVGIGVASPLAAYLGRSVAPGLHETRSMRFVFPNVPAGTHTVRIEWRSSDGATLTSVYRTLTVQYR